MRDDGGVAAVLLIAAALLVVSLIVTGCEYEPVPHAKRAVEPPSRPRVDLPRPSLPKVALPRPSLPQPHLPRPGDTYAASAFAGWHVAGPTNWDGIIARAARHLPFRECGGFPAAVLVKGQMMQESSGIRTAVSPTGPVGLMQLARATADQMGVRDRLDAGENVSGGVRYLDWQFGQWADQVAGTVRTCLDKLGLAWRGYVKGLGTLLDIQRRTGAILPADFDPDLDAEGREYAPRILARIRRT